jgi:glycerol-1-phosphate dehydrogenase [NAD(P)+]
LSETGSGDSAVMTAPADALTALVEGAYVERETGRRVVVATKALAIEPTLEGREDELVGALGFGRRLVVVSDVNTHAAMGARIERALTGRFLIESLVLPDGVEPDAETVAQVRAGSVRADALVAVGSGTINDLVKSSAARDGKPYAVFGTAPSMNGYTSQTASITVAGHKKTLPAQAPVGAFFDLEVMAASPRRLIRAGLGDSICRSTAQWDWLLSHLLLGTSYRELPFELLSTDEPALIGHAGALLEGDAEVMRLLVRTLVLSGFGTAIVGSSAPASQGEHLVSHYIDMLGPAGRAPVFHGEQVGVTTLSLSRLQERMLERAPVLRPDRTSEAEFVARYGAELGGAMWPDFARKTIGAARIEALNARLEAKWGEISARLAKVQLPSARVEAALRAAGAPATPEEIGLDRDFYEAALLHGRDIRDRYTVLDLAAGAGRLETLVPTI